MRLLYQASRDEANTGLSRMRGDANAVADYAERSSCRDLVMLFG